MKEMKMINANRCKEIRIDSERVRKFIDEIDRQRLDIVGIVSRDDKRRGSR